MTETRFLLSERTNPNSRVRDDGGRWWGYPTRRGAITAIVFHTAESPPSPASALNVARWQAHTATVPSSYHVLVDSDHTVRTVLDRQTAFHVVGFNSSSLGLSFATRASLWGRYPLWDEQALTRAAAVCRQWMALYGIPPRWLTRDQALRGVRGFVRHSTMDPDRRGDPGAKFPATRFMSLLDRPTPTPAPDPEPEPSWLEAIMAAGEAQLTDIARQLERNAKAREKQAAAVDRQAVATRALAAVQAAEHAAKVRRFYQLDADPHSDGIQGDRVASGARTLSDVGSELRDAAQDAG